jgi:hypothetical protein
MSFLYPAFLAGAVAIAVPIVLHLLRRSVAPEVPFTAVRLLRRSPVERAERRRLRDLLLLAARIVALLLLAAAFARPYLRGADPARLRIVAIDRSYSMGGSGQFARALDLARAAVDKTGSSEQVAIVAFDDRAEVLAMPGGRADARASLDSLTPGFGATRYAAVVQKAAELAAGMTGTLAIVTDLQRAGWERELPPPLPEGWQMEILDAGSAAQNVAVTAVAIQPERIVVSVRNGGSEARSGRVRATLDGRAVADADYSVPPGGDVAIPIAWRPPDTGALAVSIDDPEGLEADNVRYVPLGARGMSKALVVTSEARSGLYLSRALETAAGEERAIGAEVVPTSRLTGMTLDQMSTYPVLALLSTRGLERRARETLAAYLRGGGGLLVAGGADVEAAVVAALVDWRPPWSAVEQDATPLTLTATDLRHPIFRPFGALAANLGQVRFDRTWRVSPDGWSIVAQFSNGTPAMLERSLGSGRVLLFASDIDRRWNDFPLHPAFVPFALETVRYIAESGSSRAGSRELTVAEAPASVGPKPGVHRIADGRTVAVNVDAREAMLARLTPEAFDEMIRRTASTAAKPAELQARQAEARQSLWLYGLMVMIAALVAESFVGRA